MVMSNEWNFFMRNEKQQRNKKQNIPFHTNQHACTQQTFHCFRLVTGLSALESFWREL